MIGMLLEDGPSPAKVDPDGVFIWTEAWPNVELPPVPVEAPHGDVDIVIEYPVVIMAAFHVMS
jgi:hypothetical protein